MQKDITATVCSTSTMQDKVITCHDAKTGVPARHGIIHGQLDSRRGAHMAVQSLMKATLRPRQVNLNSKS